MAAPIPQRIPFLVGPPQMPGAPTVTGVTAYNGGAVVAWSPPTSDGTTAVVTGYLVTAAVTADGAVAATVTAGANSTTAPVAPLANGVQYTFTVAALTGIGTTAASTGVQATPDAAQPILDPPTPTPTEQVPVAQPTLEAFPVDRPFRPENWLLSPEEVDAL